MAQSHVSFTSLLQNCASGEGEKREKGYLSAHWSREIKGVPRVHVSNLSISVSWAAIPELHFLFFISTCTYFAIRFISLFLSLFYFHFLGVAYFMEYLLIVEDWLLQNCWISILCSQIMTRVSMSCSLHYFVWKITHDFIIFFSTFTILPVKMHHLTKGGIWTERRRYAIFTYTAYYVMLYMTMFIYSYVLLSLLRLHFNMKNFWYQFTVEPISFPNHNCPVLSPRCPSPW